MPTKSSKSFHRKYTPLLWILFHLPNPNYSMSGSDGYSMLSHQYSARRSTRVRPICFPPYSQIHTFKGKSCHATTSALTFYSLPLLLTKNIKLLAMVYKAQHGLHHISCLRQASFSTYDGTHSFWAPGLPLTLSHVQTPTKEGFRTCKRALYPECC